MKQIKTSEKKTQMTIALIVLILCLTGCKGESGKSEIVQKPLPYAENALEPYISAKTMRLHYGTHHAGYVEKTNLLLLDSDLKGKTSEEIIRLTGTNRNRHSAIFNNASQAWNHEFFWESMTPKGGGVPYGKVAKEIKKDFGSYGAFKAEWIATAGQLFGSGWVWLVQDKGQLKIITTGNADNPLVYGKNPLLTVDVWEHAYYLDYQNKRSDYVKNVIEHLVDWDRVASRMKEK